MVDGFIAGWSLTDSCNLKCMHCYNSSGITKKDELTTKEALELCDRFKKFGVLAVNFGGGECPLRKDFIQICKYLKNDLGIKISLTTNGTILNLIKDNINLFDDVGVSIDFPDREQHDQFRGVPGTFDKAIDTIKFLVANNIDTEIVTCLTGLNCDIKNMKKMYEFVKKLGVNHWRLNRYRPIGIKRNCDKLELTADKLKKSYMFLSSISNGTPQSDPLMTAICSDVAYFSGCPCGNTSFRVKSNGDVSPCVYLNVSGGNIRKNSLDEIYNSTVFKQIRNRTPLGKCVKCKLYEYCKGGCAGASYIQNGHFNGPDPLCWFDSVNKNVKIIKPKKWNVHELYLCTTYVHIAKDGEKV